MSTAEIHTIDSVYMTEFELIAGGFRVKDLSGDTAPHTYTPPYSAHLYYYTTYGVWRRTTGNGKWEFSTDKEGSGRNYRPAIIRECGIPVEDDMVDAAMYGIDKEYLKAIKNSDKEVKQAVDWWNMVTSGEKKIPHDAIKKMFDECTSEKGGKDMKQLYHVILFNKETEKVDYKGYVPAEDALDAGMIAAQDGKYNNKVHLTIIKKIDNSGYAAPIVTD